MDEHQSLKVVASLARLLLAASSTSVEMLPLGLDVSAVRMTAAYPLLGAEAETAREGQEERVFLRGSLRERGKGGEGSRLQWREGKYEGLQDSMERGKGGQ